MTSVGALEVLEQLVVGKYDDPARCEGALVVTDAFATVIDEATSKSPGSGSTMTTGRRMAIAIAEVIHELDHPVIDARSGDCRDLKAGRQSR